MSLIKCKECEKEISKTAKECPNCGATTEYGKKITKKYLIIAASIMIVIMGIIICDKIAVLKSCDDGDEKKGDFCIKKHYSKPLYDEECISGFYVKDGKCYNSLTGLSSTNSTKHYYCNSGYLDGDNSITMKCVMETTYNAYYKFKLGEE